MPTAEALETKQYLTLEEITKTLKGVEYIMMAAPAPDNFKETPLHFTIFLNTHEPLPEEIKGSVLDKFCKQYKITKTDHVLNALQAVGFAQTTQDTPMPLFLVKSEDQRTIPHVPLHVMDFLGNSEEFEEAKLHQLQGWSYSYN